MIISLELSAESKRTIEAHGRLADNLGKVIAEALFTGATAGSEDVRRQLVTGRLGLTMRNPASGLTASVETWWIDEQAQIAAVGVPSNSPAASYAAKQETGGEIRPKNARALAVPISKQAQQYSSPKQMANLELVARRGRPPLLVEKVVNKRSGQVSRLVPHWVLVQRVYIKPTHWLTRGMDAATGVIVDAAQGRLDELVKAGEQ